MQTCFGGVMDLRDLYQELILDHNRHPKNYREIPGASVVKQGHNPLCGDHLSLYLTIENDYVVDIAFTGDGCAISKASASMMTSALMGKSLDQARKIFQAMHSLLTEDGVVSLELLGKLNVLAGVKSYPARVKCASLAWHTLQAALQDDDLPVTTE